MMTCVIIQDDEDEVMAELDQLMGMDLNPQIQTLPNVPESDPQSVENSLPDVPTDDPTRKKEKNEERKIAVEAS